MSVTIPHFRHARAAFVVPPDLTARPHYHALTDVVGYVVVLTCHRQRVSDIAFYEGAGRLHEAVAMKHEIMAALMSLDRYAECMVRLDVVYNDGERGAQ